MDKKKLNAKITIVVDQGDASAKTEGNGTALILGFQALAANIMSALVNDKVASLEEVSEGLKGVVEVATILVERKGFIKVK